MIAKKHCKFCHSSKIIKKGKRKTKQGTIQIFLCKKCGKRFTFSPLPAYSYPSGVILTVPSLYYLGYSLEKIRKRLQNRYKINPSLSTIAKWIREFGKHAAIKKYRDEILQFDRPHRIIKRKLLKHGQNYLFQVHRYKMSMLQKDFEGLYSYFDKILNGKIHVDVRLFSLRASSCLLGFSFPKPTPKKNYTCTIADIALKSATTNYQRHVALQKFFLATDISTVAVEVPVFLTAGETKGILKKDGGLLGHIDFLQVFGNKITILDYKPKASSEKQVIEQLLLYAIALSKRTDIHLRQFNCAWFDEKNYYIFSAIAGYAILKNSLRKKRYYNKNYSK